eukprot:scaffold7075_cov274-Pinguiococcus_pyrenoidosus.AAC.13
MDMKRRVKPMSKADVGIQQHFVVRIVRGTSGQEAQQPGDAAVTHPFQDHHAALVVEHFEAAEDVQVARVDPLHLFRRQG